MCGRTRTHTGTRTNQNSLAVNHTCKYQEIARAVIIIIYIILVSVMVIFLLITIHISDEKRPFRHALHKTSPRYVFFVQCNYLPSFLRHKLCRNKGNKMRLAFV